MSVRVYDLAHARAGEELALDWQRLADAEATLAVYMGKAAAGTVAGQLLGAGMDGATPVAIVENASLPEERIITTRLDLLAITARAALGDGPALLLIGNALRQNDIAPAQGRPATCNTDHPA